MTKRAKSWRRIRLLEVLFIAATVFGFIFLQGGDMAAPLFWGYCALLGAGGLLLVWRQYQTLDEFGRGRWLKSYAAMAMVYSLGLTCLVLWALWQARDGHFPPLPFGAVYVLFLSGGLASWATWHYLGWRDSRE